MPSHASFLIFIFIAQLSKPRLVALKFFQLFGQTTENIFHWCAELVELLEVAATDCEVAGTEGRDTRLFLKVSAAHLH